VAATTAKDVVTCAAAATAHEMATCAATTQEVMTACATAFVTEACSIPGSCHGGH
jgi:hypothetical protein